MLQRLRYLVADPLLGAAILVMAAFGVLMVYSAGVLDVPADAAMGAWRRQLLYLGVSVVAAVVMLVVAYASLFGWVVTVDDLVGHYSSALLAISDNPWIILLVIMLILLVTGMFMDAVTIMFITLPIFLPVARELGWDPVWFGVLVMINLAMGLFTPPVGINLYVAANITKLPLERIAQGALPFLMTSAIGLAIIAIFPQLTRVLVDMLR